jgi:Asp-tRNA(Asn)/Glu-tRNA(Gln) amidotransferase A subunit family amidase
MKKLLNECSAWELAPRLAAREITAEALARACIERIAAREAVVGAWTHFDPARVIAAARVLDSGPVRGMLHGLPVGVKDIIDTADHPTECGTPIYAGRSTPWDAACVAATRAAGGLVLGKTVTTELAYFSPGKTRNPHNPDHTPGGSSSGSAAAVADCMVPLAFGTQTAGSVIRPAAFCGIVGYKPTFGLVSRAGVKTEADSLDTVGFFARSVEEVALMAGTVTGRQALARIGTFASPIRIAVCHTQEWASAAPETVALFERLPDVLARAGAKVKEVVLPEIFQEIGASHQAVMSYEAARAYAHEWHTFREQLSESLRNLLIEGYATPPERYDSAVAHGRKCSTLFGELMREFDALITPGGIGEAPAGLASTGRPLFNRMWTLLGTPAISVPAGRGPNGLPLGVQIVAPNGEDLRALSAATWVQQNLMHTSETV